MSWIHEQRDDLVRKAGRRGEIVSAILTGVFTLACFGLAATGGYTLLSQQDLSKFSFLGGGGQAVASPVADTGPAKAVAEKLPEVSEGILAAAKETKADANRLREPLRAKENRSGFSELPRR